VGQYRTYHSNLSGSDLAKDVPETFHCVAVTGKETWSRCYYYGGGDFECGGGGDDEFGCGE